MGSLCPHLFQAYLSKATEILEIYEPQIISIVQYDFIWRKMIYRRILKRREHREILEEAVTEQEKMGCLLEILKIRMWGLENLITILIEQKLDNWLAEELFQAYVKHLVANMKKLQDSKICDCVQTGNLGLIQCSWFVLLEKLDSWLSDIGSSLGCLAAPLHPVKGLLGYVRHRLNVSSRVTTLKTLSNLYTTDSESDDDDDGRAEQTLQKSRSVSTPHLGQSRVPAEGQLLSRSKNGSCPEIIQELEWDDEADLEPFRFKLNTDDIFDLLEQTGHSRSVSFSSSSSSYGFEEMASQTTLDLVSTSTQTTPPPSPKLPKALPKTKVATISPLPTRIRSKVTPATSNPSYKDRLKPEDYTKWSSRQMSRTWRNESQGGSNVA